MLSQQEQIKKSIIAYAIRLNDAQSICERFQVYLLRDNKLHVLWPSDAQEGRKSKQILSGQVYSIRTKYPAFHFALNGYGYSKINDIEETLRKFNPKIKLYFMEGGAF